MQYSCIARETSHNFFPTHLERLWLNYLIISESWFYVAYHPSSVKSVWTALTSWDRTTLLYEALCLKHCREQWKTVIISNKYKVETIGKIFSRQWKSVLWIFRPYVQGPSSAQYENPGYWQIFMSRTLKFGH